MGVLTFIPSRKFSNGYIDQAISGDVGGASQSCKIYSVLMCNPLELIQRDRTQNTQIQKCTGVVMQPMALILIVMSYSVVAPIAMGMNLQ